MTARAWRRGLSIAVPIVLLFLVWPIQLGGQFGWLTTTGNSMLPELDEGALVLLRRAESAHVGDVIAYHSPELDRTVLHRVIEVDGNTYVTKGDNNEFVDGYRPTRDDILGRMIFHVPNVGKFLIGFVSPLGIASLVAFAFGVTYLVRSRRRGGRAIGFTPSVSGSGGGGGGAAGGRVFSSMTLAQGRSYAELVTSGLGIAAVVLVVVGAFSFLQPTSETKERAFAYNNTGTFDYLADAGEPSVVYPDGVARPNDPVFLSMASVVQFTFEFRSDAPDSAAVSGQGTLTARVSDQDGWEHTVELAALSEFSAPHATLEGALDLAALRQYLDEVQALTLVNRPQYNVEIVANFLVTTRIGDTQNDDVFAPSLLFRLNAKQLTLQANSVDGATNSLTAAEGGTIETEVTEPTKLSLLGFGLPVVAVRILVVAGLAAVALAFGLVRSAARSADVSDEGSDSSEPVATAHPADRSPAEASLETVPDEALRIAQSYGPLLVPIAPENFYVEDGLQPAANIEELVALATQTGALIMCTQVGGTRMYQVNAGGSLYRYTLPADGPTGAGPTDADTETTSAAATVTATNAALAGTRAKKHPTTERTAPARKASGAKAPTRAERAVVNDPEAGGDSADAEARASALELDTEPTSGESTAAAATDAEPTVGTPTESPDAPEGTAGDA